MIKGASMFSSAGIAEVYFEQAGIKIVLANELIEKRAKFHKEIYPECEMICGDICDIEIKNKYISKLTNDVKFLLATPPCQGASTLGKNKKDLQMELDDRNSLIFSVFDVIDAADFDYILIENVPRFLDVLLPYDGKKEKIKDIIEDKYKNKYKIEVEILNAQNYGIAQSRPRAIIKLYKKQLEWEWPKEKKVVSLREAIGGLPSIESGQTSDILYHTAKQHNERDILCMSHTATGKSAMANDEFYPRKIDGTRIKGFHNTYKRMKWDSPAPARTMNNGNIGSHNNVHPGNIKADGTYSDARVLTLLELFIVSSLPKDWKFPNWASDSFIRHVIGESIPPRMAYEIVKTIRK